ncbi:phenylacetyl-CoA ligase [Coprinopsis cinerea okayama7|uniref:Phenylacetyl-CoA ligase n=1 Tax=Coprinopsis cinerea (strain Okayama-7 / 130 / ATCC MYA-4618 / FGSC 9003) TaxID=240176 RepID=A8NSJ4_COPC7|nr:phenylacetyl-CoA ligase [Coprinopsis cinerea okayama7\|eukprot:XP_001836025.1 phenylacetyl-CoA ligase [Coprinopsis cinerea okayama7\
MEFLPQPNVPLPHLPDDLTLPQFILDAEHPTKPKRNEDIPWLIDDETGRRLGGAELKRRTLGLSNALHLRYGIGRDDVVLVYSRNHTDYPVAIWATQQLGGVISGANPDFSKQELVYQIQEAKARLLIAHPQSFDTALAAARETGIPDQNVILFDVPGVQPPSTRQTVEGLVQYGLSQPISFTELKLRPGEGKTKLAFLSFSSGTTGRPKAVAIQHHSVIVNIIQWAVHNKVNDDYAPWSEQRFRPGDVATAVLPFYHIYGLVLNLHALLHAGMSVVVTARFNIDSMMKSIAKYRITHLYLVPPMVVQFCKYPGINESPIRKQIRLVFCGAAPLTHELNAQMFELFPNAQIGQGYGMTESGPLTMAFPISQKRGVPGSSGHLLPGTVARVVKFDGTLAGYDEPGELWIKTPAITLGYANNEEATRETFIDGWVRTGDEVVIDKAGEEIMKVRGFQVAPAELEGCLLEHPDVSNACVVGIPDDYSGEVPLAFVALSPSAATRAKDPMEAERIKASITKHVADQKVHYKRLAGGVEFIAQIPVSPSGKLLRRVLRDQAKTLAANRSKPNGRTAKL